MSQEDQDDTQTRSLAGLSLLAEALTPVAPGPAARELLLTQLHGSERWTPWAREVARRFAVEESDARTALRAISDQGAWRPGPWAGSGVLVTPGLWRARTIITRLPPGLRIPAHRHEERELTYVLDGQLLSDATPYGAGSLLEMTPGSEHSITIGDQDACLVVFSPIPREFLAKP